jgi:hypothetical protein
MSSILPRPDAIQDIKTRFETADHTESDFETLLRLVQEQNQELSDEKVKNLSLEIDNFFLRGGQIPNQ